ncbi:unnamed protein product, partial [Iphiclides podalirius]
MIGPPDPVSNLRRIVFKQPVNESGLEERYRKLRIEVQEWNQKFWTQHNSRFFQEREEYLKKNLPDGKQNLTADEMSVFYKSFLDKNWKTHITYNMECRFVVQTKDKLLRTDMGAEIQQFLTTTASIAQFKDSQEPDVGTQTRHSIELPGSDEIISLAPLLSEAPRLVGLPGSEAFQIFLKNSRDFNIPLTASSKIPISYA